MEFPAALLGELDIPVDAHVIFGELLSISFEVADECSPAATCTRMGHPCQRC